MRSIFKTLTIVAFCAFFLGGCATDRAVLNLKIPEANVVPQSNGKSIFINSVTDDRIFEERPNSPDIPSLGFGGAGSASDDIKKRAIARKRNSYGKALGDILLADNQTTESTIRDSLIRSFRELGYEVIPNKENLKADTISVDTSIKKFWSWFNPGFVAITLNSEIETKITISNQKDKPKEIYVKSDGKYPASTEGNWIEIMNESLQKFNVKVKEHFSLK
jgi:hypothetical protein